MCCFAKRDAAHLRLLLWRTKLLLFRNKFAALRLLYEIVLFIGLGIFIRYLIPVQVFREGPNFDEVISLASGATNVSISQDCINRSAFLVGLVDDQASPLGGRATQIWELLQTKMAPQQKQQFKSRVFPQISLLEEYQGSDENAATDTLCFAIHVREFSPAAVDVDLRFTEESTSDLRMNQTEYQAGVYDVKSFTKYQTSGIAQVMAAVAEVAMAQFPAAPAFRLKVLPTYSMEASQDTAEVVVYGCLNLALQMIPVLSPLLFAILADPNEFEIYQLTKSMGMRAQSLLGATFVTMTALMLIVGVPIFFVLHFTVLRYSSLWILLVALVLYANAQLMAFVFFFFASGKAGIYFFLFIQLVTFLIQSENSVRPLPSFLAYPISVVQPGFGFGSILRMAINFEVKYLGEGLQLKHIMREFHGSTPLGFLIMMAGSLLLMTTLSVWLWPIFQVKDGEKLSLFYCCQLSYYKRKKRSKMGYSALAEAAGERLVTEDSDIELVQNHERELIQEGHYERPTFTTSAEGDPYFLKDTLRLTNLVKEFQREASPDLGIAETTVKAVDNLTVSIFKHQILALLGHNGAGKTSTIGMLTGFIEATSGSARAFGLDLFGQRDLADEIIGICPQENVLVHNMTVMENLFYFCGIRGMTEEEIEKWAAKMLDEVSMKNKADSYVWTLSGGQKRKLQLLIALAGDTKLIMLDEPSSGMDPTSRRDTWELIKNQKQGRIIILTTHYMDEADYLGDRIAVMSKGRLKCCGSSLFLKKKFGVGTLLEIRQRKKETRMTDLEELLKAYYVEALIQNPSLDVSQEGSNDEGESEIKGRIDESNQYVVRLPSALSYKLDSIFRDLDTQDTRVRLNVASYNVRISNLEEVFNKIGEQEHKKEQATLGSPGPSPPAVKRNGRSGFCRSIRILLCSKRMIQAKRRNEIRNNVFFVMILELLLMLLVAKNMILSWPSQTITDIRSLYNETSGGDFNLALAPDLEANPEVSMDQFASSKAFSGQTNLRLFNVSSVVAPPPQATEETVLAFSKRMFETTSELGLSRFHGGLLLANQSRANIEGYTFANLSSSASILVMSALSLESIVQSTVAPGMKMTIRNNPLPPAPLFAQALEPPIYIFSFGLSLFPFLLFFSKSSVAAQVREQDLGVTKQLLLSGVTKAQLFFANVAFDAYGQALASLMLLGIVSLTRFDVQGLYLPLALFSLAQPAFNQFFIVLCQGKSEKQMSNILTLLQIFCLFGATIVSFMAISAKQYFSARIVEYILCSLPTFAGPFSLLKLMYRVKFEEFEGGRDTNPWGLNGCLPEIFGLAAGILGYPLLTVVWVQSRAIKAWWVNRGIKTKVVAETDWPGSEVRVEEERIGEQIAEGSGNEIVQVHKLRKVFRQRQSSANEDGGDLKELEEQPKSPQFFEAVKDVSFRIAPQECFVLLGVNGAGKSTTFKCLTAEERLTSGKILLDGTNITKFYSSPEKAAHLIGYCPQTNPLIGELTVRENLVLMGQLKGLVKDDALEVAEGQAANFQLGMFKDTRASNLSGGNKRKLCTAIAMMNRPPVIFLDESSAGVDPYSRRLLWKTIRAEGLNSALLVTTHSMEEAEALGNKLAIMVDGQLKCLGTAQEIKAKYGEGFSITLSLDFDRLAKENKELLERIRTETTLIHLSRNKLKGTGFTIFEIRQLILKWFRLSEDDLDYVDREEGKLLRFQQQFFRSEFSRTGHLAPFYIRALHKQPFKLIALVKEVLKLLELARIVHMIEMDLDCSVEIDAYTSNTLALNLREAEHLTIGAVFSHFQGLQQRGEVLEFSAQATSLEQVFNKFAKSKLTQNMNESIKVSMKASVRDTGGFDSGPRVILNSSIGSPEEIDLSFEGDKSD